MHIFAITRRAAERITALSAEDSGKCEKHTRTVRRYKANYWILYGKQGTDWPPSGTGKVDKSNGGGYRRRVGALVQERIIGYTASALLRAVIENESLSKFCRKIEKNIDKNLFLALRKQENPIFGNKGDTALLIVAAKPPRCVRIA
uniref:Uncharacterized protein n=1 Tax=Vespula pensylvanica TaxID=30213 RepID=A0A834KCZ5_VESPE|nr:hypothetical protein H0235_015152 [Vespula pensylvanica]